MSGLPRLVGGCGRTHRTPHPPYGPAIFGKILVRVPQKLKRFLVSLGHSYVQDYVNSSRCWHIFLSSLFLPNI